MLGTCLGSQNCAKITPYFSKATLFCLHALCQTCAKPLMPTSEFIHSVRSALTHLYDNAFLQNHPLGYLLVQNTPLDNRTRSQTLRRTLLDAIEQLRPQGHSPSESARAYAILSYRCIDGLAMEEIEQKLALSRRQTYREYSKGIEAVASQLWDRIGADNAKRGSSDLFLTVTTSSDLELEKLRDDVHLETIRLSELFEGVCNLLKKRLLEKTVSIELNIPPNLQAQADRTFLRQSLILLLSYALDLLCDGGVIKIEGADGAAEVVLSLVATPTVHSPLLERWTEEASVVQTLLNAQQGSLLTEGDAQTWYASIHLQPAPLAKDAPAILVVDDNEDLLTLFRRYLAGHRINVVSTSGSRDAFELACKLQPALIVLDMMMPYADGWDVLQALRGEESTNKIPVIICSVLKEQSLALSLGANDYLCKPVSQPQLLEVLQRWLGTLHPLG